MIAQSWLTTAKKGDLVFVCTGNNNIPEVVTRVTKLTIYVRRLKFRRTNGTFMRPRCSPMSVRGAASYRIVERECCEAKGVL